MRAINVIAMITLQLGAAVAWGQERLRPEIARLGRGIEVTDDFPTTSAFLGSSLRASRSSGRFSFGPAYIGQGLGAPRLGTATFDENGDKLASAPDVGEAELSPLGRFAMFFAGIGEKRFLTQTQDGDDFGRLGVNFVNASGFELGLYEFAGNRRVEDLAESPTGSVGVALTSNGGLLFGLGYSYAEEPVTFRGSDFTLNEAGTYSGSMHAGSRIIPFDFRFPGAPEGYERGANDEPTFIAVWDSTGSVGDDASGLSIQARFFDFDAPFGDQFQVNDLVAGSQLAPRVAVAPGGDFVVTWTSESSAGDDDSSLSIQARRFAADGTPKGPQFQVNQQTEGFQLSADVAAADDGSFFVVWRDFDPPSGLSDIQVRGFDADGVALGDEATVNLNGRAELGDPRIAIARDGLAISWPEGGEIILRGTFRRVFLDGFED